jgi:hypothetical protein
MARPNYAEDVEMEMDFDYQPAENGQVSGKTNKAPETTPTVNQQAVDTLRSGVSTRRTSAAGTGTISAGLSSSREQIPGTSTFSANPMATTSMTKKRRAGASNANLGQATTNPPQSSGQTTTPRGNIATQSNLGLKDTNMLSFENCQGYLKNGKLKADDGSVLAVNGT